MVMSQSPYNCVRELTNFCYYEALRPETLCPKCSSSLVVLRSQSCKDEKIEGYKPHSLLPIMNKASTKLISGLTSAFLGSKKYNNVPRNESCMGIPSLHVPAYGATTIPNLPLCGTCRAYVVINTESYDDILQYLEDQHQCMLSSVDSDDEKQKQWGVIIMESNNILGKGTTESSLTLDSAKGPPDGVELSLSLFEKNSDGSNSISSSKLSYKELAKMRGISSSSTSSRGTPLVDLMSEESSSTAHETRRESSESMGNSKERKLTSVVVQNSAIDSCKSSQSKAFTFEGIKHYELKDREPESMSLTQDLVIESSVMTKSISRQDASQNASDSSRRYSGHQLRKKNEALILKHNGRRRRNSQPRKTNVTFDNENIDPNIISSLTSEKLEISDIRTPSSDSRSVMAILQKKYLQANKSESSPRGDDHLIMIQRKIPNDISRISPLSTFLSSSHTSQLSGSCPTENNLVLDHCTNLIATESLVSVFKEQDANASLVRSVLHDGGECYSIHNDTEDEDLNIQVPDYDKAFIKTLESNDNPDQKHHGEIDSVDKFDQEESLKNETTNCGHIEEWIHAVQKGSFAMKNSECSTVNDISTKTTQEEAVNWWATAVAEADAKFDALALHDPMERQDQHILYSKSESDIDQSVPPMPILSLESIDSLGEPVIHDFEKKLDKCSMLSKSENEDECLPPIPMLSSLSSENYPLTLTDSKEKPFVIPVDAAVPLPIGRSEYYKAMSRSFSSYTRTNLAHLTLDNENGSLQSNSVNQNLRGWTIHPTSCKGKHCQQVQLRSQNLTPPACPICGGSGSGFDGMYLPGGRFDEHSPGGCAYGSAEAETSKHHASPSTVNIVEANHCSLLKEEMKLNDRVNSELDNRLMNGWYMTNSFCTACLMPLIKLHDRHDCVFCDQLLSCNNSQDLYNSQTKLKKSTTKHDRISLNNLSKLEEHKLLITENSQDQYTFQNKVTSSPKSSNTLLEKSNKAQQYQKIIAEDLFIEKRRQHNLLITENSQNHCKSKNKVTTLPKNNDTLLKKSNEPEQYKQIIAEDLFNENVIGKKPLVVHDSEDHQSLEKRNEIYDYEQYQRHSPNLSQSSLATSGTCNNQKNLLGWSIQPKICSVCESQLMRAPRSTRNQCVNAKCYRYTAVEIKNHKPTLSPTKKTSQRVGELYGEAIHLVDKYSDNNMSSTSSDIQIRFNEENSSNNERFSNTDFGAIDELIKEMEDTEKSLKHLSEHRRNHEMLSDNSELSFLISNSSNSSICSSAYRNNIDETKIIPFPCIDPDVSFKKKDDEHSNLMAQMDMANHIEKLIYAAADKKGSLA